MPGDCATLESSYKLIRLRAARQSEARSVCRARCQRCGPAQRDRRQYRPCSVRLAVQGAHAAAERATKKSTVGLLHSRRAARAILKSENGAGYRLVHVKNPIYLPQECRSQYLVK